MNGTYAVQPQRRQTGAMTTGSIAKTTRRQRLTGLEIATLVAIAALLIAGVVSVRPRASSEMATQAVQVQVGDTLWSIAEAHPIAGLTTAQAAESISRSNRLSNSALYSGQTLLVPVEAQRAPQVASR